MQQTLQHAGLAHDAPQKNPERPDETNPLPQQVPAGAEEQSAVAEPEAPEQEPPPQQPAPEETTQPSP